MDYHPLGQCGCRPIIRWYVAVPKSALKGRQFLKVTRPGRLVRIPHKAKRLESLDASIVNVGRLGRCNVNEHSDKTWRVPCNRP
jgi:hypothetical protein